MSRSEDYDDRRNRQAFPEDYGDEGKVSREHPAEAPAAFLEPRTTRPEARMDFRMTGTIDLHLSEAQLKEIVRETVKAELAAKGQPVPANATMQIDFKASNGYDGSDPASFDGCDVKITYTPSAPTRGR